MICMNCDREVVDCICPDMDARLKAVGSFGRPAAMQNLMMRAVKKSLEGGGMAEYEEDGQRILVKILENNSTRELVSFLLEVVKQITPHPIGKDWEPGETFEISANPIYAGYTGWTLSPAIP